MTPPKDINEQIKDVQSRLERAIENGHTRLASQEAKLLESLNKIKAARKSETKPMDIGARRKQRDVLLAVLQRRFERMKAAESEPEK